MPVSPFASNFSHLCQSYLVVFSIFFASILFSIATSSALTSNQSNALGTASTRTWPNSTLLASQALSKGSVIVISIATFLFLLVVCCLIYCCFISPYCSNTRRQQMLQSRATSARQCTTPTGGLLLTKSQKLLLISVFCVVGAEVIAFDPLCANPSEFPHLMHTIGSIDGALWAISNNKWNVYEMEPCKGNDSIGLIQGCFSVDNSQFDTHKAPFVSTSTLKPIHC